ncbi:hypothetical protein C8Q73DRAFT_364880 [Cubamyces lactineus]|nr:hypothetical protein C8Q73DRAFT_364880 [Cubamyces lactineus]
MNRTVDDQNGDSVTGAMPSYLPDSGWTQGSQCPTCNIYPGLVDVSRAIEQTWHDSTYHPGQPDRVITVSFTGTAVYVYNLIANNVQYTTTLTNLSFSMDGTFMQQYTHTPDAGEAQILYSVPVFSHTNLPNQPHTLEIRANGPSASLILFDALIYTVPDEPTTTNPAFIPSSSTTTALTSSTTSDLTPSMSPATSHAVSSIPSSSTLSDSHTTGLSVTPATSLSDTTSQASTTLASPLGTLSSSTGTSPPTPSLSTPFESGTAPVSPDSPKGNHAFPVGAIVGIVCGLVGIALVAALLFYLWRRCHSGSRSRFYGRSRTSDASAAGCGMSKELESGFPSTYPSYGHRSHGATPRVQCDHEPPGTPLRSQRHLLSSESFAPPVPPSPLKGDLARHQDPVWPNILESHSRTSVSEPQDSSVDIRGYEASGWSSEPHASDGSSWRAGSSVRALRAEVATLQRQLNRLLHLEQDTRDLCSEPPPRYEH